MSRTGYCLATCLVMWSFLSASTFAQLQMAGSGGSPPALQDSFVILLPDRELAYAFTTAPGVPKTITELQVAAYHYAGIDGDSATFRIYSDVAGAPGTELVSFVGTGLPSLPAAEPPSAAPILSLPPSASVALPSLTTFWLAASTADEQVNWVHGLNALSQGAIRLAGESWNVDPGANGNAPAFALIGTPMPEPSALALATLSMLGVARLRRSSRT